MLASFGIANTPFGMARVSELLYLEPLPGLPVLAPLGNLCPTGATSTPFAAAGTAEYIWTAVIVEHIEMAGATGYVDAAENAVNISQPE